MNKSTLDIRIENQTHRHLDLLAQLRKIIKLHSDLEFDADETIIFIEQEINIYLDNKDNSDKTLSVFNDKIQVIFDLFENYLKNEYTQDQIISKINSELENKTEFIAW